jgi:hypothetical protein
MFKELFCEKVSPNCDNGSGVAPVTIKGWKVIRTEHLDDPRPPSGKERDEGFTCDTFEELVEQFLKKRPLIQSGNYNITWKNSKGYQSMIVSVNAEAKEMTFITIIHGNKSARDL